MIGLMSLHWGLVDLTIKVDCPNPASGGIEARDGSGGTKPEKGRGSTRAISGSGGTRSISGSGGN